MFPLARLLPAIALLCAGAVAAQGLGGSGPLRLRADQAELDNARGISIYTGNVELTREGVRVTGDRMVVYTDDERELERIVITGDPATYYDERQGQATPVEAEAPRMEYYASGPERIRLLEGATLWQGENRFQGETIVYEPGSERITADSAGSGERIDILLFPQADDGASGQ
jgi:lipopolysaccharide export system protein LptA